MSDKNTYIYILKLEQDKYYIGRTGNPLIRLKKHYLEYGSAWTNKYPPVETLEVIPDCDKFDEDKITKQYMAKYGIDNVRGGSYCQLDLSDEQKSFINREISNVKDVCYNCGKSGHFISRCPWKRETSKTINISDFDFIENKQYDNGFVGIVDMHKSATPEPEPEDISVCLPLVNQYGSDDYMIEDTDSDESEEHEYKEDKEDVESEDEDYEDYEDDFIEEYDELINQSNDSKNILGVLNNNKALLLSYSIDFLFIVIPTYYVYRMIIL